MYSSFRLALRSSHRVSIRVNLITLPNVRYFASQSTTPQTPRRRGLLALTLSAFASLTAYTAGSIYPPPSLSLLFPKPAPAPPTDPASQEYLTATARIEKELHSLPLLQSLRSASDANEWYETRPYATLPEERRVNSLTAGALRGPGKLAVPPVVWAKRDESEAYVFVHLGRGLCGHDGIIHGGLLATLIDESLGRQAIVNLPSRVGVTATLNISYRAPTKADQFIVIKTKLDELKGRKAFVSARVEDMNGTLLVEATAMFVQPRYAKLLMNNTVRQAIGEPPASSSPVPSDKIKGEGEPLHLADGEKLSDLRKEK
ncbi:Thioesterase/thiol ester dehydrase-isomerase [Dendrothele bispora CBS 962.96]|uniref:Thioesterase/thiol ester dehydrase-isomerase n=1 Tax=Dendrothele bispora (strain CBS 962.96) TaxID=1314807 RepID=A0A4S8LWK7_DENBC|nr:Thioesterase/thiol ester dehydrase-isomerase [Dendrothele bispora CBS 962.96]